MNRPSSSRCLSFAVGSCLLASVAVIPANAQPAVPAMVGQVSDSININNLPPGFSLSISEAALVVDYEAPWPYITLGSNNPDSCTKTQYDGYSPYGDPGEPALLSVGVLMGIPLEGEPELSIQVEEYERLPGKYELCPVATRLVDQGTGPLPAYHDDPGIKNPSVYSKDRFLPGKSYTFEPVGMIRSQRVAQLLIVPYQFNPVSGELRRIRHLKLEIDLSPSVADSLQASGVNEGLYEQELINLLVNYEQAKAWRLPRPATGNSRIEPTAPLDGEAYKILVNQDGMYRLTHAALQAAGIPMNSLDPRTLRLFNNGVEVPITVDGESDGVFNSYDYLIFNGHSSKTKYTHTNVYWLSWGIGNGLRMAQVSGVLPGNGTPVSASRFTHRIEQNTMYLNISSTSLSIDHWFWEYILSYGTPVTKTYSFSLPNLSLGSATATIRALIKGIAAIPQHHTQISINGILIDDRNWPPDGEINLDVDVPQSVLLAGNNTITITCPSDGGITQDISVTDWFEVEYLRNHLSDTHNSFFFTQATAGFWDFAVDGFSSDQISIFDISDPASVFQITGGSVSSTSNGYQVNFEQDTNAPRSFYLVTADGWLSPLSIIADQPSSLRNGSNSADYIVISHPDFISATQPLVSFRHSQGLRTVVVDVNDIYDEFNDGVFNPEAITEFLQFAYANWTEPAPAYVLLVGDGHYDFLNHYGDSGQNFIPPYLGEFDPWIGETASDNRYVTISGTDNLPDISIGRLPARSAGEVTAMVNKILAYEQASSPGSWISAMAFVADDTDGGGNFPALSDQVANISLINAYIKTKIYYGITHTTIESIRDAIIGAINSGQLIVNYVGHGGTRIWGDESFFRTSSIPLLTNNNKYPFAFPMTCMEGYYIFPQATGYDYPSLAESLVRAESKGAIASFSPTGFGLATGHDLLAQGLYTALFQNNQIQLGPATTAAKYYLYANSSSYRDLIDTYTLFGDPATRLKTSPTAVTLTSFTGNAVPGGSQLDWQTANENWLIGFNLYRAETSDGPRTKLNTEIIPADFPAQMTGSAYQYFDPQPPGTTRYYWLESILISGTETTGPVPVTTPFLVQLPILIR